MKTEDDVPVRDGLEHLLDQPLRPQRDRGGYFLFSAAAASKARNT